MKPVQSELVKEDRTEQAGSGRGARWRRAATVMSFLTLWTLGVQGLLLGCGGEPSGDGADTSEGPDSSSVTDTALSDSVTGADSAESPDTVSVDSSEQGDTELGPDSALSDVADTSSAADTIAPQDTSPDAPPNGYPASGLLIRIIAPGGNGTAASVGSIIRIAGVLFGEADSIVWQHGDQTGAVAPGIFWQSGPITLSPGDNRVVVTASRGDRSTSDSVVVTYNPAFRFDDALRARPSVLWVGVDTEAVFTIPTSLYTNADPTSVRLLRVDDGGNVVEDVGAMRDDGALDASGDEIAGDGVFTLHDTLSCDAVGALYYRAKVRVTGALGYEAVSPVIRVDCIEHVTAAECSAHKGLMDSAAASLVAGTSLDEVVASLTADPSVKAAGPAEAGGYSAWVQFNDGLLGAVLAAPEGKRGAGGAGAGGPGAGAGAGAGAGFSHLAAVSLNSIDVGSKRAIVLAPFSSEFGPSDDAVDVANAIANTECPSYDLEGGTVIQGANASLDRFRALHTYGVASISTHGEALFGGVSEQDAHDAYQWRHVGAQEVLWTGSPVNCGQLLQTHKSCAVDASDPTGGCPPGTRCLVTGGTSSSTGASNSGICLDDTQVDLKLGRVVITNRGYAVTPAFFSAYRGRGFPSSLVNLGACRSLYNGTLASSLYASGAKAITGFSGYVESAWARSKVLELFDDFGAPGDIGTRFVPGEDPDNPGTFWRLFGAPNLNLSNAEIINPNFETGDASGWTTLGDGRVVAQLGSSSTVDGKFMGLISTGLGYTLETGTLEQTFCIPEDTFQIEFYWKFFSEEFKEFCGSQYQDTFQAVLVGAGGQITLVDAKVDDLCGYEDGTCGSCDNPSPCDLECAGQPGCQVPAGGGACAGSYNCDCGKYFVGLTPSDIAFDQGGVFNVLWQRTVMNVQALAGTGPVTLRLFATDTGDSVFDTAILIDAIKFK